MTTKKMKNENNAKKKLIPATGMLLASAMALSSSTYAWFTMSKEVEVQNIQMTATVPEDIQISLGAIGSPSEENSLAKNAGFLTLESNVVKAPAVDTDWSNTADISSYYAFGKLIPASSTDGVNVYATNGASGVGRTLKADATFVDSTSDEASKAGKATAHTYKDANDKGASGWASGRTGNYTPSTAWNTTNDDGYYVDIPVWLRTSSSNEQDIYVYGYVSDKTQDVEDGDDLYQAVRVAILKDDGSVNGGCLTLGDGSYPTNSDSVNILDSKNYNDRTSGATGINAVSGLGTDDKGAWGAITQNNATATVAQLSAGNGTTFGDPTKLIVRVWLEGEDGNCWNENANQDWNISLKFTKDALTATPQNQGG